MRVVAIQFASGMDPVANRAVVTAALRGPGAAGASLVVLPEASLCGFGGPDTDLTALAEPLDGPFVTALAAAAAETGATVVAGTFEPAGGRRVYNTLVAVGPGGLLASYRKVHLYDALGWRESDRVAPGDAGPANAPVVPVGELSVGMLTCYDLRFPEAARQAVDAGATALAVPAAWVAGPFKEHHWRRLLEARAIENTCYVIGAAQPGPAYTGCTRIVDPFGTVLSELGPLDGAEAPAALAAEVAAEQVREAREALPVLAHRRFGVVPLGRPGPTA